MLPHFENSKAATIHIEPIYRNLYDIHIIYNDNLFDKDDLCYINENITRYDLRKEKIIITLNMLEKCSITKICAIFNDIKQIVISIHNHVGHIKKEIVLDVPKNCLDDFGFIQDLNDHNKLAYLDVTIKYTEITSEIIL